MKKKAFTIIELLISVAIIIAMVSIAVPMFSKMGNRNSVDLKDEEVLSLINQAYLLSKSPEKDATKYIVDANSINSLVLYRDTIESENLIRKVTLLDGQSMSLSIGAKRYLIFNVNEKSYCNVTDINEICSSVADFSFFSILTESVSPVQTKTVKINYNPFGVKLE